MLAEHLGTSVSELRKNHLKRFGFRYSIKENSCSKNCVFLTNINGSRGCAIYHFRPMQCRNWPFWPGNLNSSDDWNAAAVKCPGVNKGRLYSFEEVEKIKKQKQWWKNTNLKFETLCNEVKQIYNWLDSIIKPLNNQCEACGKCCHFDSFGHKLFITAPELLYFKQNVKNLKPMPEKHCPYLENGKCSARNFRFAGCRIFLCRADKDLQNKLSEKTVEKFKILCDKYNIPYFYKDLAAVLNNL